MFTIITADPDRKRLFSPKCRLVYTAQDGAAFAALYLKRPHRADWCLIRKKLGDSCGRVLLGDGISPPPGSGITLINCGRYSRLLALNGLNELLAANRECAASRSALLVDLNCRHQAFADLLVRFFRTVRIVTRNCELYRHYSASKLYECGAAVLLSESIKEGKPPDLYVSPDGILFPEMSTGRVPVIVGEKLEAEVAAPVISSFRAPMPPGLISVPKGVDSHAFQAALFEYCGVGKLACQIPDHARLGNLDKSMNELKMFLFSVDKQATDLYN